jgi:hypothetical protein
MPLDLRLSDLRLPRIATIRLDGASRILREITSRNVASATQGVESRQFKNRKEQMKQRLMSRDSNISFDQATDEIGREGILLSLYLEYATRSDAPWLPAFDDSVASLVLGQNGRDWHSGRRRRAIQLFFTHFEQLPALRLLINRILESQETLNGNGSASGVIWHRHRARIFAADGPEKVASAARSGESLVELMDRFVVPREGRFSARLKECYLLAGLETTELGNGQEVLQQLEAIRSLRYEDGVPLGAAALRIMTRRVLESGGEWKGDWADWILRLGCDPALPPTSEPFGRWWGCWHPTRAELECAQRALNRKTLEYFIQFLEASLTGTSGYDQFEARAGFLRWLDDTRKILRFKLLLHPHAFQSLPSTYRQQKHRVSRIEGAAQGTSVIVMECIDEVWIVEGTHSFAIRAFRNRFPLPEVFTESRSAYLYSKFTQGPMHRYTCAGIWKAHIGDWVSDLLGQMQWKFHIEPPWRYR